MFQNHGPDMNFRTNQIQRIFTLFLSSLICGESGIIEQMATVDFRTFAILKFRSLILSHPIWLAHTPVGSYPFNHINIAQYYIGDQCNPLRGLLFSSQSNGKTEGFDHSSYFGCWEAIA